MICYNSLNNNLWERSQESKNWDPSLVAPIRCYNPYYVYTLNVKWNLKYKNYMFHISIRLVRLGDCGGPPPLKYYIL
jgi:hypothetical protein